MQVSIEGSRSSSRGWLSTQRMPVDELPALSLEQKKLHNNLESLKRLPREAQKPENYLSLSWLTRPKLLEALLRVFCGRRIPKHPWRRSPLQHCMAKLK